MATINNESDNNATIIFHTYRFKYTDELTEELAYFSKLHQYDDRKQFKEEWNIWKQKPEIDYLLTTEFERLTKNGQKGDVLDKIFKSARYYYRKKDETQVVKSYRKTTVSFSKSFLDIIDANIESQILYNAFNKSNYNSLLQDNENITDIVKKNSKNIIISDKMTPANAFSEFYKENETIINNEKVILINKGEDPDVKIMDFKIKKTFKNRFLIIKKNLLLQCKNN